MFSIANQRKAYNQAYRPVVGNPVYPFIKSHAIDLSVAGHEFETGKPLIIKEPFRFFGIRNAQGMTLQLENDIPQLIDSKQFIIDGLYRGGECGQFKLWWYPTTGVKAVVHWSMVAKIEFPADIALGGGVTQMSSSTVVTVANTRLPLVGVRNGRTELIVQADGNNTDDIIIGSTDSTADSALVLHPDGIFSTLNYSGSMDCASTADGQRLRVLEVF